MKAKQYGSHSCVIAATFYNASFTISYRGIDKKLNNKMISSIVAFSCIVVVASALSLSRTSVLKPFTQGNAFKVISGLKQFDAAVVKNVVSAACLGGASHVDLACDASLVRLAKSISLEMPGAILLLSRNSEFNSDYL